METESFRLPAPKILQAINKVNPNFIKNMLDSKRHHVRKKSTHLGKNVTQLSPNMSNYVISMVSLS